jgi:hypothetical protein
MLSDLDPKQRAPADYMSDLSETGWHAGWLGDLEYWLWDAATMGPRPFGQMELTHEHVDRLRNLSSACGGWIRYDDSDEETFVPIEEWRKLYDARQARTRR